MDDSTGEGPVNVDVVVVGGGVSGLSAAYRLHKADPSLTFCVLEAKDRVGGRTVGQELKAANGTDWWDLGGQWVGCTQVHVMSLIKDLGLEVYKQFIDGRKVQQIGGSRTKTYTSDIPPLGILSLLDLHFYMRKFDSMVNKIDLRDPFACPQAKEWDSMTAADFMRNSLWTSDALEAIESAGRCIFGIEPSQMSVLYFLIYAKAAGGLEPLISCKTGMGGQEYKVKGGAFQISQKLAETIGADRVRLEEPVLSIDQTNDDYVSVVSKKNTYHCKKVIVCSPPGQTVGLEFNPCLPLDKLHVMQKMTVGYITKIIVTYKKSFWKSAGLSGEAVTSGGTSVVKGCDSGPLCILYDATTSNDNPALVSFIGGRQQIDYARLSPEERKRAVLNSLAELYGNEALHYIDYAEKNWNEEPYNQGGPVSVATPGMLTDFGSELRKPFERIHFGGTESATVWCGFINGAIQSGFRAANEVLYNIRPQLITASDLEGTAYDPRSPPKMASSRGHGVIRYTVGLSLAAIGVFCFKKFYTR